MPLSTADLDRWLPHAVVRTHHARTAAADADALLRQPWPNKALLSMWLHGAVTDYTYLPVENPLARFS